MPVSPASVLVDELLHGRVLRCCTWVPVPLVLSLLLRARRHALRGGAPCRFGVEETLVEGQQSQLSCLM